LKDNECGVEVRQHNNRGSQTPQVSEKDPGLQLIFKEVCRAQVSNYLGHPGMEFWEMALRSKAFDKLLSFSSLAGPP
jgi:hypothetical protein